VEHSHYERIRPTDDERTSRRKEILEQSVRPDLEPDPILDVAGYDLAPGLPAVVQMPYRLRGPAGSRLSLADWASDPSTDRILIQGVVGAGKSSLLRAYFRDRCREALVDHTRPIPLLLRVRDLVGRDPLEAAASTLRIGVEGFKCLRDDPHTEWLLLLDGADEHPRGWHVIESVAARFGDRCRAVVVSSRPVGISQLPRFRILDLEPWSEEDVEAFLTRWSSIDDTPVRMLRSSPAFRELRTSLLCNPLLATLCLVVVTRQRSVPADQARLYLGAIELLVEEWRKQRNVPEVLWQSVARALSQIAYHHLKTGAGIDPASITDLMRRLAVTPITAASTEVEKHLGVFVPNAEGTYDFLFRGLAEHFAATEALERGDAHLLELAGFGWSEEVVRHAVGLEAVHAPERAIEYVRRLAGAATDAEPAFHASYLRPFVIALRICGDLRAVAQACAPEIAVAARDLLADEKSCWIGDRIAAELSHLPAGSPILAALVEPALAFLDTDEHPAEWFAGELARSTDRCVEALFHRDPHVRLLGVQRLEFPESNGLVFPELFDDGLAMIPRHDSPSLQAGLAIRRASRSPGFEAIRAMLERLLASNDWVLLAAVAAALHPTEADPRALARALQLGTQSLDVPLPVIDELVAAHETAVTESWPQWRETRDRLPGAATVESAAPPSYRMTPPPSPEVRARFLRALRPIVGTLSEAQRAIVTRGQIFDRALALADLLVDGALDVLPQLRLETLGITAQRRLGLAAVLHEPVRTALLEHFRDRGVEESNAPLPGVALEGLVAGGNEEAIAFYARWIPRCLYNIASMTPGPPADVLRHPRIFEVALQTARCIVERPPPPRIGGDEPPMRSGGTPAAAALAHYRPVWLDDPTILASLKEWTMSGATEDLLAVLVAVSDAPIPAQLQTLISARCRTLFEDYLARREQNAANRPNDISRIHACLHWVAGRPEPGDLRPVIERLTTLSDEVGVAAAAAMIRWLIPKEAAELSARAAAMDARISHARLDEDPRPVLIATAPWAWAEALERQLEKSILPNPSMFVEILPHLPSEFQRRVATAIHERGAAWELPWISDLERYPLGRPADVARRVLYDAGLPLTDTP